MVLSKKTVEKISSAAASVTEELLRRLLKSLTMPDEARQPKVEKDAPDEVVDTQ